LIGAPAVKVKVTSEHVFTDARLADYQDRTISLCDLLGVAHHQLHRGALFRDRRHRSSDIVRLAKSPWRRNSGMVIVIWICH
jgi:hypothetical protein